MGDHPTDSSAQEDGTDREEVLGRGVLEDGLIKTQWQLGAISGLSTKYDRT